MKLKDYLRTEGIKINVFAQKIDVSPLTVTHIRDGYDTSISTGDKIEKATRGLVKLKDLVPTKTRMKPKKDEDPISQSA